MPETTTRERESYARDGAAHPGGQGVRASRRARHRGGEGHRHLQPPQGHRLRHAGQGLREHRLLPERASPSSTARRESSATAATRSRSWPNDPRSPRWPTSCSTGSFRPRPAGGVLHVPQRVLPHPRGHAALLRRVPARLPPHGNPGHDRGVPFHVLSRSPRSWTKRPSGRSWPTSSPRCARSPPSPTRNPSASPSSTRPTSCATCRTSSR